MIFPSWRGFSPKNDLILPTGNWLVKCLVLAINNIVGNDVGKFCLFSGIQGMCRVDGNLKFLPDQERFLYGKTPEDVAVITNNPKITSNNIFLNVFSCFLVPSYILVFFLYLYYFHDKSLTHCIAPLLVWTKIQIFLQGMLLDNLRTRKSRDENDVRENASRNVDFCYKVHLVSH